MTDDTPHFTASPNGSATRALLPADPALRHHGWAALAPPKGALARLRWTVLVAALANIVLSVPLLIWASTEPWPLRLAAMATLCLLGWRWLRGYRRDHLSAPGSIIEFAVLVLLGLALTDPLMALPVVYAATYLNGLYGSWRRVAPAMAAIIPGYISAVGLSQHGPWALGDPFVLAQVPSLTLISAIQVALTRALLRHERSEARRRVLATAGAALVAAQDRGTIHAVALDSVAALLEQTPAALTVVLDGPVEAMTVAVAAGFGAEQARGAVIDMTQLPVTVVAVEAGVVADLPGDEAARLARALGAGAAAFAGGEVLVCPLASRGQSHGAIVVATPGALPNEFASGLESLSRVVALALESAGLTRNLRASEARFRSLVQNASDVVTVVDENAVIRYISPTITRVMGHTPESLVGTVLTASLHPEDVAGWNGVFAAVRREPGSPRTVELRARHANGSWRWLEITLTNLLDDPDVAGLVSSCRDITERRELQAQLVQQAFHDALTGLANRALLQERVHHALARAARTSETHAVLFLDLDGFKTVNDSLGHAAGDRLLAAVAGRLVENVRPSDSVARLGGDEFAVFLEGVHGVADAVSTADRLLAALRTPFTLDGRAVVVGASIGIALSSPSTEQAGELLRNADAAMYISKSQGKGRYTLFESSMHVAVLERLELEADLRRAVERNEFVVHYQPTVAIDTGRITGAEALVRWQHPTQGLLPPAAFIPLAEETGLIVPIGRWVLEESCRQARIWQTRFPSHSPFQISVNLSARQVQHAGLVEDVARALTRAELEPASLILEVTENVMMQDSDATIARLHELRDLGVRLAIDDFGAGYSSLSCLHRFPMDIVKIDRSFIAAMGEDLSQAMLARAVIQLGQTLRVQTVAEGVERAEQATALCALGCDVAQGFYYAAPLDSTALNDLLARGARM
ncbi:MAG: EAL domain-containing protein [Actinobacteria bacterium]|nr:EAL domain-containing protein [Actinomycetota bacterium]